MEARVTTDINRLERTKSRPELVELCRQSDLVDKGTKHELATRIIQLTHGTSLATTKLSSVSKIRRPPCRKVFLKNVSEILKEEVTIPSCLNPRADAYDPMTGFIFSHRSKNVVARYHAKKKEILTLTTKDIDLCKELKFRYEIPETLVIDDHTRDCYDTYPERREKILAYLRGQDVTPDEEEEEEHEDTDMF